MALSLPALLLVLCSLGVAQATVRVYSLQGSGLNSDATSATDGYVKVYCDSTSMGRTAVRPNNASPWWEEEFTYYPAVQGSILRVEVYDQDVTFDDMLGACQSSLRVGTYSHTCYLAKGLESLSCHMGGCGSYSGSSTNQMIPGSSSVKCMSKCPWARY